MIHVSVCCLFLYYGLAGKHMAGHERRTVYVHGVHACCSKAVFKAAVVRALTSAAAGTGGSEADPLPAPDRILIAQPTWNNRDMERFDRYVHGIQSTTRPPTHLLPFPTGLPPQISFLLLFTFYAIEAYILIEKHQSARPDLTYTDSYWCFCFLQFDSPATPPYADPRGS